MKKLKLYLAFVLLGLLVSPATMSATIFADQFNRTDRNKVGRNWEEINRNVNDVAIFDHALLIRDDNGGEPGAAATHLINTQGFDKLRLTFAWQALAPSDADDLFYVSWSADQINWTTLFARSLGGSGWTTSTLLPAMLSTLNDFGEFYLRFWTDLSGTNISKRTEGVLIDYVKLTGHLIPTAEDAPLSGDDDDDPANVPEPSQAALLALGLFTMLTVTRKTKLCRA
jgi:hypothetical protein